MGTDHWTTRIRLVALSILLVPACASLANAQTRPMLLAPQAVSSQDPPVQKRENGDRSLTLEHIEELALANNPTLGGAAALVMQQRGLYVQVGLYPNPTVGYIRSDPDQSKQSQTQGVFVSQDIVTGNKLQLARSAQRFEIEHSSWQYQAQRTRILNDVRIRFFETLGAQQAIAAAQELERLAAEGVQAAEQLLKAKQGSRPDLLQAEIQLSAVRATLRDAQFRHQSAWRQLAAVVGVPDLAPALLNGNLAAGIPTFEWDALSQKLLAENPLLMAQQSDIRAAEYEVRLARAQVIPNLNVQVVAQRDTTDKFSSVSTLLSLPIPIFNRNQGNILSAEGRLLQQRREFERLQLALLDQLAGSFRQYQSLRNQAAQLQTEILPRAKENLDLTLQAYKLGKFDFARVLTARQLYFQSNLAYIDALTELHKSSIEITGLQLTGGLNPTEAGTALQTAPGASGLRGFLLQQLQEQRGGGSRNLPGAIQAGNP